MSAAYQIVVAEDDTASAMSIAAPLELEGFSVAVATTTSSLEDALRESPRGLLILAGRFGAHARGDVLKRIAEGTPANRPAVMVISSDEDDEVARIVAFELGVDDYLVAPISTRELALRARAILRRLDARRRTKPPVSLSAGPFEIDRARHELRVDGELVALTPLELRLLAHFVSQKGRVARREQLLSEVWHRPPDSVGRVVDTSVKRLRSKLGASGAWIETIRGVGYRLRDTAPEPRARCLAS